MDNNYHQKDRNPYLLLLIMLGFSLVIYAGTLFWIFVLNDGTGDSSYLTTGNEIATTTTTSTPAVAENAPIPESALVKVPFTTQAPKGIWDATHEETCEEASLIMLQHFTDRTAFGSTDQIDQELLSLVDWETQNGYKLDVTLSELNEIAKNHFDMKNGVVKTNISVDNIKREIASGHPVIVGAAGKILPNPNFKDGGPLYHMLVVVGYDKDGFITNDPGTRKGEGFRYTFDGLYNAIHDWNASDIMAGGKNYLVFK